MKNRNLKFLLTELLEELQERFAEDVLRRTRVSEVRTFGRHVRIVYADGQDTFHSIRRYRDEPDCISAYDAMRLGLELPELCPGRASVWPAAVFPAAAVAGIGLLPLALFGAFRRKPGDP